MNNQKLLSRKSRERASQRGPAEGGTVEGGAAAGEGGTAPGSNPCPPQGLSPHSCQGLEAFLLAGPLAVTVLDRQGTVQSWNPAAQRMFGWSQEEVWGNPLLVVPQDEEVRYRNHREMLHRGEARTGERIFLRKKDGSRFLATISAAPLFDEAGRMNGSLHIFQAIPQAIPQAIAQAITPDIAQDSADDGEWNSQRIEELKMDAVGQLARGLAHELNNSVGAILGWAELGLDELPPLSPLRKPLDHILKEAGHASDVTRDLVSFSQRQALEMYAVDLNHVVEQALGQLGCMLPPRIAVKKRLTTTLPRILADPEQIERVLMDLCLYAKDAMPEGSTLRIETEPGRVDEDRERRMDGAPPGNYAVLCISHDGARMDEETLRHIFEPNGEPFGVMPRDGKRRGLGLAAAYGIIRQHGGFISAANGQDCGTSFRVYLPVTFRSDFPVIASGSR